MERGKGKPGQNSAPLQCGKHLCGVGFRLDPHCAHLECLHRCLGKHHAASKNCGERVHGWCRFMGRGEGGDERCAHLWRVACLLLVRVRTDANSHAGQRHTDPPSRPELCSATQAGCSSPFT